MIKISNLYLPEKLKKIAATIDTNKDDIISPEEVKKALDTLKKADEQKKKNQQIKFTSYMNSYNS